MVQSGMGLSPSVNVDKKSYWSVDAIKKINIVDTRNMNSVSDVADLAVVGCCSPLLFVPLCVDVVVVTRAKSVYADRSYCSEAEHKCELSVLVGDRPLLQSKPMT